jgi:hypothetical protein
MRPTLLFAFLLALLTIRAAPQKGAAKASPKKGAVQAAKPAAKAVAAEVGAAFDEARTSLPANFAGNDFRALYRKLALAPKGEFETTEAYEARRAGVAKGVYAFRVPDVDVTYDTDAGEFTLTVFKETSYRELEADRDHALLVLAKSSVETGRYVGSNAFGATRTVRRVTEREWGVAIPGEGFGKLTMQLKVPAERAKELKERLAVLAVCAFGPESVPQRITGAFADEEGATGAHVSTATLDSPIDLQSYVHEVKADVKSLWVFDRATGEVLKRFDSDGLVSGEIPPPSEASAFALVASIHAGMTVAEVNKRIGSHPHTTTPGANGGEEWVYTKLGITVRFAGGVVTSAEFHSTD